MSKLPGFEPPNSQTPNFPQKPEGSCSTAQQAGRWHQLCLYPFSASPWAAGPPGGTRWFGRYGLCHTEIDPTWAQPPPSLPGPLPLAWGHWIKSFWGLYFLNRCKKIFKGVPHPNLSEASWGQHVVFLPSQDYPFAIGFGPNSNSRGFICSGEARQLKENAKKMFSIANKKQNLSPSSVFRPFLNAATSLILKLPQTIQSEAESKYRKCQPKQLSLDKEISN